VPMMLQLSLLATPISLWHISPTTKLVICPFRAFS
jgi:hypothetical protein